MTDDEIKSEAEQLVARCEERGQRLRKMIAEALWEGDIDSVGLGRKVLAQNDFFLNGLKKCIEEGKYEKITIPGRLR